MTSTANNAASKISAATILGLVLVLIPTAARAQEPPSFTIVDFGVLPWIAPHALLLRTEAVQAELKLSDAQKKEQQAIIHQLPQRTQQLRREINDRAKFVAARDAMLKELGRALIASLTPEQRVRLDQIQLQARGPMAFARRDYLEFGSVAAALPDRLKLSEDQVQRANEIYEAGDNEIREAGSFPLVVDTKDGPPTMESVRKLVEGPEFQAAKEKACNAARAARGVVTRRIEQILSDDQRRAYHELLGQPFDLSRLRTAMPALSGPGRDAVLAARLLGVQGAGGGQRADPSFSTKVAKPAYVGAARHPRVLFDEAHHNFHTAGGRYKPFAELMKSDGYEVIPNREKFSRDVLKKGDILVIANALGAEGMGQPDASNPAFTDAECDAVRDWIKEGGSLLFITDHAPMGSAAQCLAKRLGVSMSTGATSDPSHSEGGDTMLVFSRQNQLLGDHPITRGRDESERVNKIQTFTGTSVKGPEGSVPILKLADTAVDLAMNDDKPASAAGRAQGVAFSLGNGRIVVMGEAAELSAQVVGTDDKFGMNVPGIDNRQMAINIMHWLSGLLEPRKEPLKKAG